ncbi:hypothetical protein SMICM304S_03971 [Streptomyces microflavus]
MDIKVYARGVGNPVHRGMLGSMTEHVVDVREDESAPAGLTVGASVAREARRSDAWARPLRPWDGYFAVVWAVTVVLVLGAAEPSWRLRVVAAALVGLTLPWYLWAGRPALRDDTAAGTPGRRYVLGAVLLFLPAAGAGR